MKKTKTAKIKKSSLVEQDNKIIESTNKASEARQKAEQKGYRDFIAIFPRPMGHLRFFFNL